MNATTFKIEIPPQTAASLNEAIAKLGPASMLAAVAHGMDVAAALTVSDIQANRLSGKGPFPVEEHRLGVVTNRLRSAVRASRAQVTDSQSVTVQIGANVKYAALHEWGGTINRVTKDGSVRLRTDRAGNLVMRGNLATFAKKKHKRARVVGFAGGKQYTVTYPARAPFGHGIADNETTFIREIAKSVTAALNS